MLLDTDQDGYIDKSNAILIIRGVGISGLDSVFESVIQSITTEALSFEDVLNVAISMKRTQVGRFSLFVLWRQDDYDSIIQVFKMFDKNQDGTVLAADLRHILSHLGEVIPEDEIDALFHALGYGDVIKYEDFAKQLMNKT